MCFEQKWDIAAGHAVLLASDCQVTDTEGKTMRYAKWQFSQWGLCGLGIGRSIRVGLDMKVCAQDA
jgi:3'-phosphoadenosine 5'-phosphosulfate (PAPS) 3'-phosphatase